MNRQRGSVLITVVVAFAIIAAIAQLLNLRQGMAGSRIALQQERTVARHLAEAGLRDALWRTLQGQPPLSGERSLGELGSYSTVVSDFTGGINVTATGRVPTGITAVLQRSYAIPCYQKTTYPAEMPYASGGTPSSIYESSTGTNDRNRLSVDAGNHVLAADNETRVVIKFDLSTLAGKEIQSARLLMDLKEYDAAMEGATLFLHALKQAFNSQFVTWSHATGNAPKDIWQDENKNPQPGGYLARPPSATTIVAAGRTVYEWNIRELAGSWVTADNNKKSANHGVIILTDKTSSHANHPFHFHNAGAGAQKPRLLVRWCEPT